MAKRIWSEEEKALLGAIHAAPRDDAPRLIYSRWLEEHGEIEYAEFIRRQCGEPGGSHPGILAWTRPIQRGLRFHAFVRGIPVATFRSPWALDGRWDGMLERLNPRLRLHIPLIDGRRFKERLQHPLMLRADRLVVFGRNEFERFGVYSLSVDAARDLADSPILHRLEGIDIVGGTVSDASKIIEGKVACPVRFLRPTD